MSGPLHNPAASYDFGGYLAAMDATDAYDDGPERAYYAQVLDTPIDDATFKLGFDRTEAAYNAWCDEQAAAQREDVS